VAENSIESYQEFIQLFPHDPLCDRIRALLANLMPAKAWHNTLLANSPVAYKSFYDKFSDSPCAQSALKLAAQPKMVPLSQPKQIIAPPSIKLGTLAIPQGGLGTAAGKIAADKLGNGGHIVTLQSPGTNSLSGNNGAGKIVARPGSGLDKTSTPPNARLTDEIAHIGDRPPKSLPQIRDHQPPTGMLRRNAGTPPGIRREAVITNGGGGLRFASTQLHGPAVQPLARSNDILMRP